MNSPESITVSLEWAKKLKKAGWPQDDAVFYHCINGGKPMRSIGADVVRYAGPDKMGRPSSTWIDPVAAPTAEEILRRLPPYEIQVHAVKQRRHPILVRVKERIGWRVWAADTLADAAAGLYCNLAEDRLLPSSFGEVHDNLSLA